MKRFKRLFSLLAVAAMVLTMNMTAFAADHSITIEAAEEGEASHTFEVYQIFTGTYGTDDEENGVLSDLKWGKNGTGTEGEAVPDDVIEALEAASGKDAEKLAVIEDYFNDGSNPIGTVTSGKSITVADGYYILLDTTDLSGKDDANSTNVVQVVGEDITVKPKTAKPTVDKEVYDDDDGSAAASGDNNGWGETADHQIGESFQFKLTAVIPKDANMDAYSTYQVVFQDTMSDGVTFESIESVVINDEITLNTGDYASTATAGQEGGNWSLTIDNIKDHVTAPLSGGVEIEVIYNAHLNENAAVNTPSANGSTTNENEVYLQYSNNPNGEGLGETAPDSVWVFTYQMPNQKVNDEEQPLEGAGFTLYSGDDPIHVVPGETAGEYRVARIERYDSDTPVYEAGAVTEMTSAKADGGDDTPATFNISGLDAGTYTLKETKTPNGYNTCEDVTIVISAVHSEDSVGVATTNISMTQNGEGTDINTIINESGTILPETGGIGTIIFYVVGGVLMVGAAALFITRRRAQK